MCTRVLFLLATASLTACGGPPPDRPSPRAGGADRDADGDGWISEETGGTDCDDLDPRVSPGAPELCNAVDDDCDGWIDDVDLDLVTTNDDAWYADEDQDGSGVGLPELFSCEAPVGRARDGDDCDDADPALHPRALEVCDEIDNDCDGWIDDEDPNLDPSSTTLFYEDVDGDGYGVPGSITGACDWPEGFVRNVPDCAPDDPLHHSVLTWWLDADGDGAGDAAAPVESCGPPPGGVDTSDDCDDADADEFPGQMWYRDGDGDGLGDAAFPLVQCERPDGYVLDASDPFDCGGGRGAWAPYVTVSDTVDTMTDLLALDLDEDGHTDIVVCSDDGLTWYANAGDGTFGAAQAIPSLGDCGDLDPADVDGDGDLDLVHADGDLAWSENLGGGAFGALTVVTTTVSSFFESVAPGDVDLDGDLDLIVVDPGSNIDVGWFTNLGGGVFDGVATLQGHEGGIGLTVAAGDLDGDGDADVVVGDSSDAEVLRYTNTGGGAWSRTVLDASIAGSAYFEIADLDLDGQSDIVVASSSGVRWYENLGSDAFAAGVDLLAGHVMGHCLAVADVDGDADPDVLSCAVSGTDDVGWHENLGGGTFAGRVVFGAELPYGDFAVADLDHDTLVDVIIGSASSGDALGWFPGACH